MENVKNILNNIKNWALNNRKHAIITFSAIIAAIIIVVSVVLIFNKESRQAETEKFHWGDGITQNIPQMSETDGTTDFSENGNSATLYYTNITTEQVNAYIIQIESQLGIRFQGDAYPRSAIYGDKIIAIHYNVTEMNFSITITTKTVG